MRKLKQEEDRTCIQVDTNSLQIHCF